MPFYCGKRSAAICVVLSPKKSSTYSSEYASGFFELAALHLPASPSPRNEGLLGQTPSRITRHTCMHLSRLSRASRVTARMYGSSSEGAYSARLPNLRVSSLQ